ncbi:MAG: hypothetical protein AAFX54_03085 [Pseudomonadota bacterium]
MTTAKKKTFMRAALLSTTLLFATSQAQACYTVHFDNKSNKDIYTVWTALGCADMKHWVADVCQQEIIKAGESKSYNYKWGTTRPSLVVFEELNEQDHPDSQIEYALHSGAFEIINNSGRLHLESASSCGKSYTINFTEEVREDWF